MDTTSVTVALGTIVVLGVGAQWLGRVTGIPTIVLLLLGGIVAGPVTGLVDPEELLGDTLDPAVTLAVGLLLFDSGFSLNLHRVPKGIDVVYRLVSVGAVITWVAGGVASYLIFDISASVAAMLGVVLIVSGPTVVGPIVKASRPRGSTGTLLEWEGSILDPLGATLGAAALTVITTDTGPVIGTIGVLLATIGVGAAIGAGCAALFVIAWRNYAIPDDLQVPVAFMFAVLAFSSASAIVGEAGLFATLTLGLVLGNQREASVARVRRFQASIGTLVIGTLFIVLAATIDLDDLRSVLGRSVLLLAVFVLIARPLATLVSTLGSPLAGRDRGFVASVAPKGIVAASTVSVYAAELDDSGLDGDVLVPITFAVIIGAGVVYGFGSPWMARVLGVGLAPPKGVALFGSLDVARPVASALTEAGVPVLVVDHQADDEDEPAAGYELFTGDIVSQDLLDAFHRNDVGTALVGTGQTVRDYVAMRRSIRELGKKKTYYLPRLPPDGETGPEARWRARTPPRFVAFGPEVTCDSLRELLGPEGAVRWFPVDGEGEEGDEDALPPGAIPLFIVTAAGRATVATRQSLREARSAADPADDTRLLCGLPEPGGDPADASTDEGHQDQAP